MQSRNKRRSRSPQNIQGRKNKRIENTQDQITIEKDASSVDTVKQTNGTMEGNTTDREYFSFLQVRHHGIASGRCICNSEKIALSF